MQFAQLAGALVFLVVPWRLHADEHAGEAVSVPVFVGDGDKQWPAAATEGDLRFDAVASVDSSKPALVHAKVTITNLRDVPRSIHYGACVRLISVGQPSAHSSSTMRLRLYRTAEHSDAPVWESRNAGMCKDVLVATALRPHASVSPDAMTLDVEVSETASGALPEGTYFATVTFTLSRPSTSVEVPAGVVTLRKR